MKHLIETTGLNSLPIVEYDRLILDSTKNEIIYRGGVNTNGHSYVDLGLPSGTLWATMNVGATSETDYGYYFQWGETISDTVYDWAHYKYCNGSYNTMTKYCTDSSYGAVDNKTTLDSEDDAATQIMGGKWRMPTLDEFQELYDNTTSVWVEDYNGTDVKGRKFTSKTNGNSIFLPATGFDDGTGIDGRGFYGYYWSSSLHPSKSYEGLCLNFDSSHVGPGDFYYRSDGLYVRGVRK